MKEGKEAIATKKPEASERVWLIIPGSGEGWKVGNAPSSAGV